MNEHPRHWMVVTLMLCFGRVGVALCHICSLAADQKSLIRCNAVLILTAKKSFHWELGKLSYQHPNKFYMRILSSELIITISAILCFIYIFS